jgi:hypothetical protein
MHNGVGVGCVEDVRHFLLARLSSIPAFKGQTPMCVGDAIADSTTQGVQSCLMSIFDCHQHDQLAHVVYTMTAVGSETSACCCNKAAQQVVEEDVELVRIQ